MINDRDEKMNVGWNMNMDYEYGLRTNECEWQSSHGGNQVQGILEKCWMYHAMNEIHL